MRVVAREAVRILFKVARGGDGARGRPGGQVGGSFLVGMEGLQREDRCPAGRKPDPEGGLSEQ